MSEKGSPFQKGGGGTNFEQCIQTAFVTTLITGGNAPCVPKNEIIEVGFQTSKLGYQTDDLFVKAKSDLAEHKLLIQIKHNITFSSENSIFNEVINAFWKDFNNNAFDKTHDRLLIIKNRLNNVEKNHIKGILNFAKTHASASDFFSEVNRIKEKRDRLNIFAKSLQKANDDKAPSQDEIWQFLFCVDLLGYDFLNEGSVDLTHFLNLIKLSRSNKHSASEREIWDTIYSQVVLYNSNGGNFTKSSILTQDVSKYFDVSKLNPAFDSIKKLKSDGELIYKPLRDTIADFHIPRESLSDATKEAINGFSITILAGKPGAGKSAALKSVLKKEFPFASVFVFRADSFNKPHLANVFSDLGIHCSIEEMLSGISLIPDRIMVIESLEKLLEGEAEAFKQLLAIVREKTDIKIVATSRQYAVELLNQKLGLEPAEVKMVQVDTLSDPEISIVLNRFPQLNGLIVNEKIKAVLRSPKYLEFAISALSKNQTDFSGLSLVEFKNRLWNHIVEDYTTQKNGLAGKRRKAFLNIAIKRAKKMELFIEPDSEVPDEAIEALVKDEVIFREAEEYKFSPSHDILEDWALTKYIGTKYAEHTTPKEFFDSIGNEPAIRRAFRLWIEDYLTDDINNVSTLVKTALEQSEIERYWADELLVAIFKSDNATIFFEKFKEELLQDNARLLNRCIHLIRTSCKENRFINGTSYLFPVGSGWRALLLFIQQNLNVLDTQRLAVLTLLEDWNYKLLFEPETLDSDEINAVVSTILLYIQQIESEDAFWKDHRFSQSKHDRVIKLFLNLTPYAKESVNDLISRSDQDAGKVGKWQVHSFHEAVIKHVISGLYSRQVAKELPEQLLSLLEKRWKSGPPEKSYSHHGIPLDIDREEYWGIHTDLAVFPPSIYKTPIYFLLQYHPNLTCAFIVKLINYSVNTFVKSDFRHKKEIKKVPLILPNGKEKKIYGSYELWVIYRGLSVTNYLFECMLMSLEKYLLSLASYKTDWSRSKLNELITMLIETATNSAIHGVLASVAMAYPTEVNESILPIFSVKEFYNWDGMRNIREMESLAMQDDEIPFSQRERSESNQLPHRKKYMQGMSGFIVDYQFNVGRLNNDLHKLFDTLKLKAKKKDIFWKKRLSEIDIRTWKVSEYDEQKKGYTIQPQYTEEVSVVVNAGQEHQEAQNRAAVISNTLSNAYDGKENIIYEQWKQAFLYYKDQTETDILFHRPITCAFVGLRDFGQQIDANEKEWCLRTLTDCLVLIIQDTLNSTFGLGLRMNLIEKEITLNAFHLIYSHSAQAEKRDIVELIYWTFVAPFPKHEVKRISKYFREIFFKEHQDVGLEVWRGLITYAKFHKTNRYYYDDYDRERLNTSKEKEAAYVAALPDTHPNISIEEIDFDNYAAHYLTKAVLILPYTITDPTANEFILKFLSLAKSELAQEEDYSARFNHERRELLPDSIFPLEVYYARLLFHADKELSFKIIDVLLELLPDHIIERDWGSKADFCIKIPEFTVYRLDAIVSNSTDEAMNGNLIRNFWQVWEYIFEKVKISKQRNLEHILLFDIDWKDTSVKWKVFEGKEDFYYKMIQEFGSRNIKAVIKVFSTVGEELFMPDGVVQLVELLKNNPNDVIYLIGADGERLIKRLFHNHISKIKRDRRLLNDFIWMLDEMINLGSSQAYFYRENVITYKTVVSGQNITL